MPETLRVVEEPPTCSVTSEIDPTAVGALFGVGGGGVGLLTVAVKSWVAVRPPGSLAVTMILPVVPAATGVIVTVLPEILTETIDVSGSFTENVRASPFGSENLPDTLRVAEEPPTCSVTLEMDPTAVGARFGGAGGGAFSTVTLKSCVAVRPPGSSAVTTILPVVPTATGAIVTVLPEMLTVATVGLGLFTE